MAGGENGPDPPLGDRFAAALALTSELHRSQARKTGADEAAGVSYLGHLLGVAAIVIDAGGSEDMAIAALLHDAVEDQGGRATLERIRDEFGDTAARIVSDCSDWVGDGEKPPWLERKRRYVEHLGELDQDSLLVSLADKLYNARAIALDMRTVGDSVWERFNADGPAVVAYYARLAERFAELRPGPLADELLDVARSLSNEPVPAP